ncbi:MAG: dihydropteroate synthase [Armatimonadetes bacterium]|nr:dihydropteroate synthase [Armatimonadota bacterium]MDE2205622.1 dihydropteroate synthase [Armatimonadota bacterium]
MTRTHTELKSGPASRRLQSLLSAAKAGERTMVMGILNVTPDSFYDGGRHFTVDAAVKRGIEIVSQGADILDVGGESTRPSTFRDGKPLPAAEEADRVEEVIRQLSAAAPETPISVDTWKAAVAERALNAGAVMINDISALQGDADMAPMAAECGATVCLMHMPGLPMRLPENPVYNNVVADVLAALLEAVDRASAAGIPAGSIVIDPGIGFGKTAPQSFELMQRLRVFTTTGLPVLVGPSRKSSIGAALGGLPPDERLEGTAAAVAICIANGAAIVRVHDVLEMVRVARVTDAIVRGWPGS